MTYDVNNKQQEMAYQLIKDTNVSFFLTGKAGTGKTTFRRRFKRKSTRTSSFLLQQASQPSMQVVIPSTRSLDFHSVSLPSKR